VARKTHKHVGETKKFLLKEDEETTEAARIGLASLQKDPEKAISTFNTAYLVILVDSYKKLTKDETGTTLFTKIKDVID